MKYILISLLSIFFVNSNHGQDWSMTFSPTDVDCVTNIACFNVMLKSTGDEFKIGSSNIRLFYNANTQRIIDNSTPISINKGYRIANESLLSRIASLPDNGSLQFDDNLGLLDIPIDFVGDERSALTIKSDRFTTIASNICFESNKENVGNSSDFIWVTEKSKEDYTTAKTTINLISGHSTNVDESNFKVDSAVETRNDCGTNQLLSRVSNYPNPFYTETTISYNVQHESVVDLTVYGLDGKVVLNRSVMKTPGDYSFTISKDDLQGAGIYLYKIKSQNNTVDKRMILIK